MRSLADDPEIHGLMVLSCDENGFTPESIDPLLQEIPLPVFGGIFPGIFHGCESLSRGSVVVGLCCTPQITLLDCQNDLDAEIGRQLPAPCAMAQKETQLIFVDGFTRQIEPLIDTLFDHQGVNINQIGAGAGSLSFVQKPCIISNKGLLQDAAQVIRLPLQSALGMAHGWSIISESLKVTGSRKNEITHFDFRPAAEVYGEIVRRHGGRTPNPQDFLAIAKAYPLGIYKLGSEIVVRDPLARTPEGGITCTGEVAVGTFMHVLHGHPDGVIAAAAQAGLMASEKGFAGQLRLFIDCLSRPLFLEQRGEEELLVVQGREPLVGVHAVGEICNTGTDYPEFYNKTAVIALLGERR
jgi:hypothetical protein